MRLGKVALADGGGWSIEDGTYKGIPVSITFNDYPHPTEKDWKFSVFVYVGYLGADVEWVAALGSAAALTRPNGRVSKGHFSERIWEPTWDDIIDAIEKCHAKLIAARDG